MITIFSIETEAGFFAVSTASETFNITPTTMGCVYDLTLNGRPVRKFDCAYKAVRAVAKHQTGVATWDDSVEQVSDSADEWRRHIETPFNLQLVANYLEKPRQTSFRSLATYFEYKHPYLMDRSEMAELIEELVVTGQFTGDISEHMMPSEFASVARNIKRWRESDGEKHG